MGSGLKIRYALCTFWVLLVGCAGLARASATLLLEEPYGKLGFFTATGHAAVYLSGVCSETPLVLRPCAPGELGAVISRYDGVGGYDWVAIPLIPYLYAVEQPDGIPLYADPKMVNFLRDQYRRKHLEGVAPVRLLEDLRAGTGMSWWAALTTAPSTGMRLKPLRRRTGLLLRSTTRRRTALTSGRFRTIAPISPRT